MPERDPLRSPETIEATKRGIKDWREGRVTPMQTPTETLRPELAAFAQLQERVLKLNDFKGGWQDMQLDEVLTRIDEELGELKHVLQYRDGSYNLFPSERDRETAKKEAVDVANFCMMLVDLL